MSFLSKLFGKKEPKETNKVVESTINSYGDFWNWFIEHQEKFQAVVKSGENIETDFFDKISPKLSQLKEGIFFLTGMLDDNTVDFILTADGNIKSLYIIEELAETAPKLTNWKFRAHKPPLNIENVNIQMADYEFGEDKMNFYYTESKDFPDEIDITIVHDDYNEDNKSDIMNGCYIFLDNFLGELNLTTKVDNIEFIEKEKATQDLVPIGKLKDFLNWREKEFIEKYEGVRHNTESDSYSGMEATLNNGMPLLAIVNTDLLEWDSKASHPWVLTVKIKYEGSDNGMPDSDDYDLMNEIEEAITKELIDKDGFLNVGRETADSLREVFFACKDFRKPCKVLDKIISDYSDKIAIEYDIYKDKYWRSFDRFRS